MHIVSSIGSVVGVSTSVHWAQTIKTPYTYGVIEISDTTGNAQEKGMKELSRIIEVCTETKGNIRDIETMLATMDPSPESYLMVIPDQDHVTILLHGGGTAYLKRGETYAKLLDQPGIISGSMHAGDVILLISKTCSQMVSQETLFGVFDHSHAQTVAEKLTIRLHDHTVQDACAALIYEVTEIQEDEPVPIESPDIPQRTPQLPGVAASVRRFLPHGIHINIVDIKRHVRTLFHNGSNPGFWIMLIFGMVLLGSVAIGIKNEIFIQRDSSATKAMDEAKQLFTEGTALMDLNPVKGRARLNSAKLVLEPIEVKISRQTKTGRQVDELYKQIDAALIQAKRIYKETPVLFYDVGLLKTGSVVADISMYGDITVLTDEINKTIYTLDISNKNAKIVAGGTGFTQVHTAAIYGTSIYVMTPEGIHIISLDTPAKQQLIPKSDQWGMIGDITTFGGNIYLLDTGKSRIWKYVAVDTPGTNGFSDIREYLNPDTLPDLSQTTGITIDGSVWMGTNDGKIVRFIQGKESTFTVDGVDPVLGKKLAVYTDDSIKNVYVLDSDNNRVVVLDKEGMYVAQYQWPGDIKPIKLVVSEKQGRILLLAQGQIYSLDLK